jgi:hypothetical protein
MFLSGEESALEAYGREIIPTLKGTGAAAIV